MLPGRPRQRRRKRKLTGSEEKIDSGEVTVCSSASEASCSLVKKLKKSEESWKPGIGAKHWSATAAKRRRVVGTHMRPATDQPLWHSYAVGGVLMSSDDAYDNDSEAHCDAAVGRRPLEARDEKQVHSDSGMYSTALSPTDAVSTASRTASPPSAALSTAESLPLSRARHFYHGSHPRLCHDTDAPLRGTRARRRAEMHHGIGGDRRRRRQLARSCTLVSTTTAFLKTEPLFSSSKRSSQIRTEKVHSKKKEGTLTPVATSSTLKTPLSSVRSQWPLAFRSQKGEELVKGAHLQEHFGGKQSSVGRMPAIDPFHAHGDDLHSAARRSPVGGRRHVCFEAGGLRTAIASFSSASTASLSSSDSECSSASLSSKYAMAALGLHARASSTGVGPRRKRHSAKTRSIPKAVSKTLAASSSGFLKKADTGSKLQTTCSWQQPAEGSGLPKPSMVGRRSPLSGRRRMRQLLKRPATGSRSQSLCYTRTEDKEHLQKTTTKTMKATATEKLKKKKRTTEAKTYTRKCETLTQTKTIPMLVSMEGRDSSKGKTRGRIEAKKKKKKKRTTTVGSSDSLAAIGSAIDSASKSGWSKTLSHKRSATESQLAVASKRVAASGTLRIECNECSTEVSDESSDDSMDDSKSVTETDSSQCQSQSGASGGFVTAVRSAFGRDKKRQRPPRSRRSFASFKRHKSKKKKNIRPKEVRFKSASISQSISTQSTTYESLSSDCDSTAKKGKGFLPRLRRKLSKSKSKSKVATLSSVSGDSSSSTFLGSAMTRTVATSSASQSSTPSLVQSLKAKIRRKFTKKLAASSTLPPDVDCVSHGSGKRKLQSATRVSAIGDRPKLATIPSYGCLRSGVYSEEDSEKQAIGEDNTHSLESDKPLLTPLLTLSGERTKSGLKLDDWLDSEESAEGGSIKLLSLRGKSPVTSTLTLADASATVGSEDSDELLGADGGDTRLLSLAILAASAEEDSAGLRPAVGIEERMKHVQEEDEDVVVFLDEFDEDKSDSGNGDLAEEKTIADLRELALCKIQMSLEKSGGSLSSTGSGLLSECSIASDKLVVFEDYAGSTQSSESSSSPGKKVSLSEYGRGFFGGVITTATSQRPSADSHTRPNSPKSRPVSPTSTLSTMTATGDTLSSGVCRVPSFGSEMSDVFIRRAMHCPSQCSSSTPSSIPADRPRLAPRGGGAVVDSSDIYVSDSESGGGVAFGLVLPKRRRKGKDKKDSSAVPMRSIPVFESESRETSSVSRAFPLSLKPWQRKRQRQKQSSTASRASKVSSPTSASSSEAKADWFEAECSSSHRSVDSDLGIKERVPAQIWEAIHRNQEMQSKWPITSALQIAVKKHPMAAVSLSSDVNPELVIEAGYFEPSLATAVMDSGIGMFDKRMLRSVSIPTAATSSSKPTAITPLDDVSADRRYEDRMKAATHAMDYGASDILKKTTTTTTSSSRRRRRRHSASGSVQSSSLLTLTYQSSVSHSDSELLPLCSSCATAGACLPPLNYHLQKGALRNYATAAVFGQL